jgi:hypothetical protein
VLLTTDIRKRFASIHYWLSGDVEVMYQCRRLELTLEPDGWRGGVEEIIAKEMGVPDGYDDHPSVMAAFELREEARLAAEAKDASGGDKASQHDDFAEGGEVRPGSAWQAEAKGNGASNSDADSKPVSEAKQSDQKSYEQKPHESKGLDEASITSELTGFA